MRIDSLTNPDALAREPRLTSAAALRSLWSVGAILDAIAVRDVSTGELWLELPNRQRLPARVASGEGQVPQDGQLLKLRVLRDSPVLAMEVMQHTEPDPLTDGLRRMLPQQTSPAPLLANLLWLMRRPEQLESLPARVQQKLLRLWQTLPTSDQLSDADGLRKALQDSGLMLETKLASNSHLQSSLQPALQTDMKAALLELRQQLKSMELPASSHQQPTGPLPSLSTLVTAMPLGPASMTTLEHPPEQMRELQQQVDGNLARLQTNQLLAAQAVQQDMLAWLVELPVLNGAQAELLRCKFQRERPAPHEEHHTWSVELALDMGTLGSLYANLRWHAVNGLNLQLRSDSAPLIAAVEKQLTPLAAALSAQGIAVHNIRCLHGMPIDASGKRLSALLDLHA